MSKEPGALQEKMYLLETRLTPLTRRHGIDDLGHLVTKLRNGGGEPLVNEVVDAMTTNETFFFRDKSPFDQFQQTVLPSLIESRENRKSIRIWCAACSTGQEPHSIAMLLKEESAKLAGWRTEIVATDLSAQAMDKAKVGLYSQFEVQRGLPVQFMVKYFKQMNETWQIDSAIRAMVNFLPLNLLRVRPETLCRITEFSEHESNGRELDEGERVAVEVLPVLGQSAAAVEPGDGAVDHPTPGLDDEALHPIGSLDDLGLEIGQDAGQGAVKDRALIGAVGEQFPEKGKQTEQGRQPRETAVAILNVGGGDDAVQQQALRIDQNRPLLALDQLAGIEAVAVDASPPFSALFTL